MLFLYSYQDSVLSEPPLFSSYFVLSKNEPADTLYFKGRKQLSHKDLILFLVENDSGRKPELIEMQLRKNHNALIKAHREKNYSEIEKYLQDDDLLGVNLLKDFKAGTTIEINDIHRMDRYSYKIILK
jgi:hypothetical protein